MKYLSYILVLGIISIVYCTKSFDDQPINLRTTEKGGVCECMPHPNMPITAKANLIPGNIITGEVTYQFTGGSLWQRKVVDVLIAWLNQFQTKLYLSKVCSNADLTFSFYNGCLSMLGMWALDRQYINQGEVATSFGGVKEYYIGTHNEGYIVYCVVHELLHLVLSAVHGHIDVSEWPYEMEINPPDTCSIMFYSSIRSNQMCPYLNNWMPSPNDYGAIHKHLGKPEVFIGLEEWIKAHYLVLFQ